ncbi:MAG: hypothetical protein U1C96_02955 [Gallionella sp.]|nr:hypothetical protein [Gallionella sp.]
MNMLQRPGLIRHKNWRYPKLSGMVIAAAIIMYWLHSPAEGEPYGGTWLGYVLGIASMLLIFLLMWYGITKRNVPKSRDRRHYDKVDRRKFENTEDVRKYKRSEGERRRHQPVNTWRFGGDMKGWLAAHINLGGALLVLVTLHSGFQFGWNIHTLSYVLTLLVIASGFYGVYVYVNYPRLITENMGEDSLETLLSKIAELNEMTRIRALDLPDDVNELILAARTQTRLGGGVWQQLAGEAKRDCPTRHAIAKVLELGAKYTKDNQPKLMRDLYALLLRKEKIVSRVRNEVMLKARLRFWLYIHAPLSIALFTALFAHVVSIYYYW